MNATDAINALGSDPAKAADMVRTHKIDRPYLGVANPMIDAHVKEWRTAIDLETRLTLAADLWKTNIHEGRIAAAKLLTQARIRPNDQAAWDLITSWVPDFDTSTIADHASIAGQKRLIANPTRLDQVETWTQSTHFWTKRAALIMTLPWTKQNHPKPAELQARERILGWAATYVPDHDPFIQKAIAWWLRDLSKHDPDRVRIFLQTHSEAMKPFAVKEAAANLPTA